ncbi:MAG: sugar phosphate isomerase/epimerase [Ruminococcaceae bacterium]|nr:sugar phosphate isomerase/epimerase [Oscillospiraceae bacterium]
MEYGININYFKKALSLEKAVELIAKAGFTQLDYTPPVQEDNWKEQMLEAAALFRAYGLSVHQTHSPFNRYGRYGDQHKLCIDRCAEATEYLGAKFMVAHGDEFDYANLIFSPEAALAYNHDYYLPYVERAAKNGYKIAFETVFDDSMGRRFTSQADELMGLITSYNSDTVVCCWDFGHANVTFRREAPAILRRFGALVQCMHLHDNTGVDAHQLPMTGDINWQETMSVLHEIGYTGIMSIEYSHGAMPEHLAAGLIDLTYRTAKHLWEM